MILHPAFYPRKGTSPKPNPDGLIVLTWGGQRLNFDDMRNALLYAETLRFVYGVTDAAITAPDGPEILSCVCGCGRLFRDGDGCRLGTALYAEFCFDRHPVMLAERAVEMAARVDSE